MIEISPRVRFHTVVRAAGGWHEPVRLLYDCELVHVLEGEFLLHIEDRTTVMRAGSVAIIGPNIEHESMTRPHQTAVRQCLHFDWDAGHSHIQSPLFCAAGAPYQARYVHPVDSAFESCLRLMSLPRFNKPIRPVIQDVFTRLDADDPTGETLMYSVLHYFLRHQTRQQPRRIRSRSDRAIFELKHHIDTHYREPLTLDGFCALTRLSRSHLCQAFRKRIGMPPNKYLNHIRLAHACRLLLSSSMNIGEVALAAGFTDNNYFCRFFKREKGMSPGAFVREHGEQPSTRRRTRQPRVR